MTDYEKLREEKAALLRAVQSNNERIREIDRELQRGPVTLEVRDFALDSIVFCQSGERHPWVFEVVCDRWEDEGDGEKNYLRVSSKFEPHIDTTHADGTRITFHWRQS